MSGLSSVRAAIRLLLSRVISQITRNAMTQPSKLPLDSRNFMCEVCGNSFKRKRTLNYHMTHKHSGHISLQQKCQTQQAGSDHQPSEMSFASFAEPVRRNHTVSSTRNNIISINRFSESMNPDYIIPDSERALREANL